MAKQEEGEYKFEENMKKPKPNEPPPPSNMLLQNRSKSKAEITIEKDKKAPSIFPPIQDPLTAKKKFLRSSTFAIRKGRPALLSSEKNEKKGALLTPEKEKEGESETTKVEPEGKNQGDAFSKGISQIVGFLTPQKRNTMIPKQRTSEKSIFFSLSLSLLQKLNSFPL